MYPKAKVYAEHEHNVEYSIEEVINIPTMHSVASTCWLVLDTESEIPLSQFQAQHEHVGGRNRASNSVDSGRRTGGGGGANGAAVLRSWAADSVSGRWGRASSG